MVRPERRRAGHRGSHPDPARSAPSSPGGAAAAPTDAERQAAKREADSLLVALRDGADFAAAARAHSDDPSSASRGGRMQPFGRGDMVASFEQAAFATPVGEFGPVIESQFGYHIIRVVARSKPPLEDLREQIEGQLARPMQTEAEDRYVTNLMENSRLEFYESNIDSLIAILDAERPPEGGERELELATFEGGNITLGEIWGLYEILPPGNRQTISQLEQTDMVRALATMVQQEIMLARAEAAATELDSLRQSQLDERVEGLLLSAYLRAASEARLEVGDEEVQSYYEEHREFYSDRPFAEVAPEIRQVLSAQRLEEATSPDVQRATLAAIADSQESAVDVERNTDLYDEVLRELRRLREEAVCRIPGRRPAVQRPRRAVRNRPPARARRRRRRMRRRPVASCWVSSPSAPWRARREPRRPSCRPPTRPPSSRRPSPRRRSRGRRAAAAPGRGPHHGRRGEQSPARVRVARADRGAGHAARPRSRVPRDARAGGRDVRPDAAQPRDPGGGRARHRGAGGRRSGSRGGRRGDRAHPLALPRARPSSCASSRTASGGAGAYRADIMERKRRELAGQMYLELHRNEILPRPVSDEELREYWNENREAFGTTPTTVRFEEIPC